MCSEAVLPPPRRRARAGARLKKLKPFKIEQSKAVSPKVFRAEGPMVYPPPGMLYDYKPPSLLVEHKWLAILLALVCIAFAVYCFRAPHRSLDLGSSAAPPASHDVYVEAIPLGEQPDYALRQAEEPRRPPPAEPPPVKP